jgi:hypothetical protein
VARDAPSKPKVADGEQRRRDAAGWQRMSRAATRDATQARQTTRASVRQTVCSGFCRDHDLADEVADEFDLIDVIVQQLDAGRFLDADHEIQALHPIESEIFQKMRLIGDVRDIKPQLIRNQRADAAVAANLVVERIMPRNAV